MNPSSDLGSAPGNSARIVGYSVLFCSVFALSWLITFGWQNRALLIDLFYQSNLERYLVATGEAGPVTYHVYHNDFPALEKITRGNEQILGIEPTRNSRIAAMAFTAHDVEAIATVREHSAVSKMLRRNIPMICH